MGSLMMRSTSRPPILPASCGQAKREGGGARVAVVSEAELSGCQLQIQGHCCLVWPQKNATAVQHTTTRAQGQL